MRVRFTSAAEAELAEAVDWFGRRSPAAAKRFLDEFDALTERLAANPRQFPIVEQDARRAGFRHFPYALIFAIRSGEVRVFACFDARRDPVRWRRRI
ncbi:type II toxin-antitoxin system RelE/ParE family toxin [Phenylobacterium montanum]|nr:type II toxin-antitoxin system RelE/ParE family toxin [Caulobacter sp. S6]